MPEQNRIAVTVGGQSFYLKTNHDEAYLLQLTKTVDSRIDDLKSQNPSLTTTKASVLIALELLDEYKRLEKDFEDFCKEIDAIKF